MTYTLKNFRTFKGHPGRVYAELRDEDGQLSIGATLDYILAAIACRGYTVKVELPTTTQSCESLDWLTNLYKRKRRDE